MVRRALIPVLATAVLSLGAAAPSSTRVIKWPPWLSIESPVNPWDPGSRGVAFYVHTMLREGLSSVSNMTGTAYGLVDGKGQTVPLEFGATGRQGVFSVRRSWPAEGAWVLRVSLMSTTALLTLDREGNVASVRIPTVRTSGGVVPREVAQREIDSTLAEISKR
jgi:hypothetical protein